MTGRLRWLIPLCCYLLLSACGEEAAEQTPPPVADTLPAPVLVDTTPPPPPPPISEYEQTFLDSGLVDLATYLPGVLIDLKYTTEDNFVHADVYGDLDKAYLRVEAADKLKKALELLREEAPGHTLLIYDGARPHRVQYAMWEVLDVPYKRNYLSPPAQGSVHNYGCAVDLTIADSTGTPLDMGTEFDFFGKLAQPQLEKQMLAQGLLSEEQHANRLLLRGVMKRAGFYDIRTEWWHFNAFPSKVVKKRFSILP